MANHQWQVRRRVADDVSACVTALADVHRVNGYPGRWPAEPGAFLTPPTVLDGWVAESGAAIVGHVLLCRARERPGERRWSDLLGLPLERVGLIRQLFVSPDGQGNGLGTRLLDTAAAAARMRGLVAALDVLDSNQAAIALYEARSWIRLATGEFTFADGTTEPIHYFRAPAE